MQEIQDLKNTILRIIAEVRTLIDAYQAIDGGEERLFELWKEQLDVAEEYTQSRVFRVAVVGSVKSGKSTFINALLGTDILKRGAGIITAFITRVVDADQIEGWVELKSWPEINAEILDCLENLPLKLIADRGDKVARGFDFRVRQHREFLEDFLRRLKKKKFLCRTEMDANVLVLDAYLNGFSNLAPIIEDEPRRILFNELNIRQHQKYVGNEANAIYLKDIEIRWPLKQLAEAIEIGDCQGIDSPNPLHFALVQDYLMKSHFIVYMISSRIGLREADIKLLKALDRLELIPHTVFVFNVDFDSHGSLEEWEEQERRLARDLSFVTDAPQIFAFSCLAQLLAELGEEAGELENRRLKLWRDHAGFVEMSAEKFMNLSEYLSRTITESRSHLVLNISKVKLLTVVNDLIDSVEKRRGFFGQGEERFKVLSEAIEKYSGLLTQQSKTLENMLDGLHRTLRESVGKEVDSFFESSETSVTRTVRKAVEDYMVDLDRLEGDISDYKDLFLNLHGLYAEFKNALAVFLVDKTKLEILRFAKDIKRRISEELEKQGYAFWDVLRKGLEAYEEEFQTHGLLPVIDEKALIAFDGLGSEPEIPSFDLLQGRNSGSHGAILIRFGFTHFASLLSGVRDRFFRKKDGKNERMFKKALEDAFQFMKAEVKKDLSFSLHDYHLNFKFTYVFSLLDLYVEELKKSLQERLETKLLATEALGEAIRDVRYQDSKYYEELSLFGKTLEDIKYRLSSREDVCMEEGGMRSLGENK